jgi:ketosteroid isomerase-like protein
MRPGVRNHACNALLLIVFLTGCARGAVVLSDADAKAIRDTVLRLEGAMNQAVDSLNCDKGLSYFGDLSPVFVSGGHVVRTSAALLKMCTSMVAPRIGATFVTDTVTAHALSPDAAYVVREGEYTINLRDGQSHAERLVMTTIWARQGDGWKVVHLHESAIRRADSTAAIARPR